MTSENTREGKRALIFGVSGQAGSYLAELLLSKGYRVTGTLRGHTQPDLLDKFWATDRFGTWTGVDLSNLEEVPFRGILEGLMQFGPYDEIFNLAADMYAPASWDHPLSTITVNGCAVWRMLEEIKKHSPSSRFFQAGSAETRREAKRWSPYATSKCMAQQAVAAYRERFGLHASCGVFYNMESIRRRGFFFAKKVCAGVAKLKHDRQRVGMSGARLLLEGDLGASRDWGLCREYVEAAWLMLQAEKPADYVIATGRSYCAWAFVIEALHAAGFKDAWIENLADFIDLKGNVYGSIDDIQSSDQDENSIRQALGWEAKTRFPEVVHELVREEIEALG